MCILKAACINEMNSPLQNGECVTHMHRVDFAGSGQGLGVTEEPLSSLSVLIMCAQVKP